MKRITVLHFKWGGEKNSEIVGHYHKKIPVMTVRSALRLVDLYKETGKIKYINAILKITDGLDVSERKPSWVDKRWECTFWDYDENDHATERYRIYLDQHRPRVFFWRPWTWHRLRWPYSYSIEVRRDTELVRVFMRDAAS